ncbi:MAG: F0F1 ATP synthase subunit A [Vampirovibrionales bacterium]|nr:F0F1 ATP synthase subunit A [Vampirovibrionales bacterium]
MGHFWTIELFGQSMHLSTLIMAWAAMGLILGVVFALTRNLQAVPSKGQVVAEGVYDFCRSITFATAGKRGDTFLFYIGALFLFILVANLMGQLPLRLIPIPHGELVAATADINTTGALAVLTLIMYFGLGLKIKGLGYFKHYISPNPLFLPLNLVEDFTRPGSLMIRLFFNILVGEILAMVAMSIAPLFLPVAVIFLELFVALIQAYIFAILSSVYISVLTEEHH